MWPFKFRLSKVNCNEIENLVLCCTAQVLKSYLNPGLEAVILDSAKQGVLPSQAILLEKSNKNGSLHLPFSSAFEIRLRKMRTLGDSSQIPHPKNCARAVSVMKPLIHQYSQERCLPLLQCKKIQLPSTQIEFKTRNLELLGKDLTLALPKCVNVYVRHRT